tara:strand:- start:474 stop:686 length:213 start_codon:yes stop_codon:yes gene_type:complete
MSFVCTINTYQFITHINELYKAVFIQSKIVDCILPINSTVKSVAKAYLMLTLTLVAEKLSIDAYICSILH